MLNKIRNWYLGNEAEITWFFIGLFTAFFIVDLGQHEFLNATIDLALVIINYIFRKRV